MSSKQEYLKRYLSGPQDSTNKKKKRRKKVKTTDANGNIVGIKKIKNTKVFDNDAEDWMNEQDIDDDAPTVESFVDDTAIVEEHKSDNWRKVIGGASPTSPTSPASPPRARDESLSPSPPRARRRHDSPDASPPRRRHDSLSPSPPRGRTRHDSPDISPPRKRNDSLSPSPLRGRTRHDSPDLSPPRKRRGSPSPSPPRRQDSVDLSPPRRTNRKNDDVSPLRRSNKVDNDDDDISPPRRRKVDDDDISPPRRRKVDDADADSSPPRRRRGDGDVRRGDVSSNTTRKKIEAEVISGNDADKLEYMADGSKAGLVSGEDVKNFNRMKKARQDEAFSKMDMGQSEMSTKAVIRDKMGRRVDANALRAKKQEEDEVENQRLQQYKRLQLGVHQKKEAERKAKDAVHEMSKSFSRSKDDKDLDKHYRDRDRADDPMAKFLAKTKKNKKPIYKGPLPPSNRYGIWPGFRWDGIDRSNGFEKKFIAAQNNVAATQTEAYAWSTEDM